MHYSININPAQRRQWRRAAIRLLGLAALLLPALCQAQTPPVYTISTIAGSGPTAKGYLGDGSSATLAELNGPTSVAIDSKGNIYICDQSNNVIREVVNGVINTIVGTASAGYGGDLGPATSAQLNGPDTVFVDSTGNLYISDVLNNVVRVVTTTSIINTVAGLQAQIPGYGGDGGPATSALLNFPAGVLLDTTGNLIIADSANFRIRKVTAPISTGTISTYAGDGYQGYSNEGGSPLAAHLNYPRGLAMDSAGDLYIADSINNEIRKVTPGPNGVISLFAGDPSGNACNPQLSCGDGGQAVGALLNFPTGVAVDSANNVYIADSLDNVIRMVTPDGIIHTIAGIPIQSNIDLPGYSGDGGPALSAEFDEPVGITVDSKGNLYVADYGNDVIRMLVPNAAPSGPGPPPVITGVQSASGFGALPAIAPGTWIEIYGSHLAPNTRPWGTADFIGVINAPTSLNGVTVSVGGYSAFVEYISPTQVNVQVPGTIALGPVTVTVNTPAGTSNAYTITSNLQEPGLWAPPAFRAVSQQSTGLIQYVGALFSNNTTFVFPTGAFAGYTSQPAAPGDTIIVYGVGFGPVPGDPPGQIPQSLPPYLTPQPIFYIGGMLAPVQFAGLVASDIGLYQFNLQVPNVPCSASYCSVPITFTVNLNGTTLAGTQTLYTAVQ